MLELRRRIWQVVVCSLREGDRKLPAELDDVRLETPVVYGSRLRLRGKLLVQADSGSGCGRA